MRTFFFGVMERFGSADFFSVALEDPQQGPGAGVPEEDVPVGGSHGDAGDRGLGKAGRG